VRKAVLLTTFNRPDVTMKVFEEIKKAKPRRLYISSDGPRIDKEGEKKKILDLRKKLVNAVDWECEVKTLFRDENLGCRKAMSGAITWFFENEEDGIILEDDCVPNQSFFKFCEELLDYYKDDKRVMHISGNQFIENYKSKYSYYFAKIQHCWGWASWADRWQYYGTDLKDYSEENLKKFSKNKNVQNYWGSILKRMQNNEIDSWAYQWTFKIVEKEGLCINPSVNLVSNIGFGEDSTHTTQRNNPFANMEVHSINKIKHPKVIHFDMNSVNFIYKNNFNINMNIEGEKYSKTKGNLKNFIKSILNRIFPKGSKRRKFIRLLRKTYKKVLRRLNKRN
jgi:hypothetical protein